MEQEKKKTSGKELFIILTVVVLAFGLTVGGIIYLTGFIIDDKPVVDHTKVEPITSDSNVVKFVLDDNLELDNKTTEPVQENVTVIPVKPAEPTTVQPKPIQPKPAQPKPIEPKQVVTKPVEKSVEIKTIAPGEEKTVTEPLISKKTGIYQLQLFAFQTRAKADTELKKYITLYPDIFIMQADLGSKGIWYRVRCCNVDTKEEAIEIKNSMEAKYGITPDIIKLK